MSNIVKNWIRANPGQAKQLEQLSVTAVYLFSNPASILSMETGFSFSSALATVISKVLTTEGDFSETDKLQMWSHLLGNTQCLTELLAQKYASATGAWRVITLITLVRSLLSLALKRERLAQFIRSVRQGAGGKASKLAPPETGYSRLNIPRVSLDTREKAPPRTWYDYLDFALELFYSFRPLLWVLFAWRGAASGRHYNSKRIMATWKTWRLMTAVEFTAAVASSVVQQQNNPIVSADSVNEESNCAPDTKVPSRYTNLLFCLARDPFFSTSLRRIVEERVVNGFVSKIPLLGMVISAQTQYALKMQQSSFLYTIGNCEL